MGLQAFRRASLRDQLDAGEKYAGVAETKVKKVKKGRKIKSKKDKD